MKKLSIGLVLIMIFALFAGCNNSNTDDVIKVGINYELTGGVATYGQSSVEGIELAIEEINKAGGVNGKKIEAVKYDNKSEESTAMTLTTRLINQDKVVAIMGPATSGSFNSTIPVAIDNKIPVASGSATADNVTIDESGNLKEYAFRICYTDSYQGTAMANFALDNLKKEKAIIIKDNSSDYGKGLAENFNRTFTAGGGTVVSELAYVKGDTDFNAILTSVTGQDFDVIFIPGYYNEAGLIIKQARAMGIDVPILGVDGFDSPELVNLAGEDALTNVYFSNHYSSLDESKVVKDFITNFKAKYNKEPDAFNALGYDLAKFIADGLSRAEEINGESLKEALASTKDFEGVTGSFSIDENHNTVKAVIIIELENGKQVSSIRAGN